MAVTTSHEFVVRACASSATVIDSSPLAPDQGELVRDRDRRPGDVGHVGHHGVHRHVPDERDPHGRGPARSARFESDRGQPSP